MPSRNRAGELALPNQNRAGELAVSSRNRAGELALANRSRTVGLALASRRQYGDLALLSRGGGDDGLALTKLSRTKGSRPGEPEAGLRTHSSSCHPDFGPPGTGANSSLLRMHRE